MKEIFIMAGGPNINYKYANGHLKNGGYWWNICQRDDLTMEFVREYANYINWYSLSKNENFEVDEDFLDEFKDKINWKSFTRYSKSMNEHIARKYKDLIDWDAISYKKYLSDDFIEEFAHRINWRVLWKYRKVDEDFLRRFKSYIIWTIVCYQQKLSIEFVEENEDRVDWIALSSNYRFSYYWRKKYKERAIHLYNEQKS